MFLFLVSVKKVVENNVWLMQIYIESLLSIEQCFLAYEETSIAGNIKKSFFETWQKTKEFHGKHICRLFELLMSDCKYM